jgi:hypothetical protein
LTQPSESSRSGANHDLDHLPRIESEDLSSKLPSGGAIRRIRDELSRDDAPRGFLVDAENSLLAASDDFTGSLGIESIKIARSRHGTAVDKEDVLEADRRLRGNPRTDVRNWMLALAGFLGGAAAAALVALLIASKPVSHASYWWSAVASLGVIAISLFVACYPRQRKLLSR